MKRTLKILFTATVALAALLICTLSANAALIGDVDTEKGVSAGDARLILRASVGLEALSEEQKTLADTDKDGKISATDARTALRVSVELEPLQHYFEEEITLKPTCTEKGTLTRNCTECEEIIEEDIPKLGHDFPAPEILTAVTCEADGLEKYTCKRKDCGHIEERTVPAGHTPDIPAATCTEDQMCTRGNHKMADKLGHTTDWDVCGNCKTFITTRHEAKAKELKAKFTEATTAFDAAYAINSYNAMLDGLSWKVIPNTKAAKPDYLKAKAAYEAAIAICGDIPELAEVKALLTKNLENIKGVLTQVDKILAVDFVDTRNFEELVWPLEELNDFNTDSIRNTNKKLTKLIIW